MGGRPAAIDIARSLVADALSVRVERIGADARMYDLPVWDSLGQLSVILALEHALQVQIRDQALFDSLTSIRGIESYLSKQAAD